MDSFITFVAFNIWTTMKIYNLRLTKLNYITMRLFKMASHEGTNTIFSSWVKIHRYTLYFNFDKFLLISYHWKFPRVTGTLQNLDVKCLGFHIKVKLFSVEWTQSKQWTQKRIKQENANILRWLLSIFP